MRPRLTRPVDEINSPWSAQEARPRILSALRNILDEALEAVRGYFAGLISLEDVLKIVRLYFIG